MNDLSQLRICVEMPAPGEEHVVHQMKQNSNSTDHFHRLRAAFFTAKLWPKGHTIKVQFLPHAPNTPLASWTMIEVMKDRREADGSAAPIDPIEYKIRGMSHEDAVKTVVRERIEPITDLKFEFVPHGGNVLIGFVSGKGSWSMLGTDCIKASQNGQKTMNLGWMDAATIMHEFGHVLGMIHEHDNPKQNPIQWNLPVLYKWAEQTQGWSKDQTDKNIVQRYKVSQLNASNFDPYSIMLYFFPAKLTTDNKGTNINQRLSKTDVNWISKMYPGGPESATQFYDKVYGSSGVAGTAKNLFKMPLMLIWLIPLIIAIVIFAWRIWKQRKSGSSRKGRYGL